MTTYLLALWNILNLYEKIVLVAAGALGLLAVIAQSIPELVLVVIGLLVVRSGWLREEEE